MDPILIRQAIREVRELRSNILEKQLYQGYSGRARILGGCIALLASLIMTGAQWEACRVFWGWGLVFGLALFVNYGAIISWHLRTHPSNHRKLAPLLEACPVWVVAGVLTLALYARGEVDLLCGMWMVMFAIVQSIERTRLPRDLVWIGVYYFIAGVVLLFNSEGLFARPWVMGLVFFLGEWCAGLMMHIRGMNLRYAQYFSGKRTD
jgi:hypothetical protein